MTIEKIKADIGENKGNKVSVLYNEGRNKIYKYKGKIVEVYSNVFIIMDNDCNCKRCFSYYDILTETVKIFFDVNSW